MKLLNLRYQELVHAYYEHAIIGYIEAATLMTGIIEMVAKINGATPDRSAIRANQRATRLSELPWF